jgi:hypothetical protein
MFSRLRLLEATGSKLLTNGAQESGPSESYYSFRSAPAAL